MRFAENVPTPTVSDLESWPVAPKPAAPAPAPLPPFTPLGDVPSDRIWPLCALGALLVGVYGLLGWVAVLTVGWLVRVARDVDQWLPTVAVLATLGSLLLWVAERGER